MGADIRPEGLCLSGAGTIIRGSSRDLVILGLQVKKNVGLMVVENKERTVSLGRRLVRPGCAAGLVTPIRLGCDGVL